MKKSFYTFLMFVVATTIYTSCQSIDDDLQLNNAQSIDLQHIKELPINSLPIDLDFIDLDRINLLGATKEDTTRWGTLKEDMKRMERRRRNAELSRIMPDPQLRCVKDIRITFFDDFELTQEELNNVDIDGMCTIERSIKMGSGNSANWIPTPWGIQPDNTLLLGKEYPKIVARIVKHNINEDQFYLDISCYFNPKWSKEEIRSKANEFEIKQLEYTNYLQCGTGPSGARQYSLLVENYHIIVTF